MWASPLSPKALTKKTYLNSNRKLTLKSEKTPPIKTFPKRNVSKTISYINNKENRIFKLSNYTYKQH